MFFPEKYTIIHKGEVVSVRSGMAYLKVDLGVDGYSCAGCSLAASCGRDSKKAKSDYVVLCAKIPPMADEPEVGMNVSVGLTEGSSLKATLLMLGLPLSVLLIVAAVGTSSDYSDGLVAIVALACAAICYLIIFLIYRRRRSPWILISDIG